MPKPSQRSRVSTSRESRECRSCSAFLMDASKPSNTKAFSLHNGLSWRCFSWKGGAEPAAFHGTRAWGMLPGPWRGRAGASAWPSAFSSSHRVGVNPGEPFAHADGCSGSAERAGIKGQVSPKHIHVLGTARADPSTGMGMSACPGHGTVSWLELENMEGQGDDPHCSCPQVMLLQP